MSATGWWKNSTGYSDSITDDKRVLLKLSLTCWATPSIVAVALPAHAQTSSCMGDNYTVEIVFTGVTCGMPDFCNGLTDEEIIDLSVKPGPTETLCISDEEISTGQFDRSIDFDGNGMIADFLSVLYSIDTITASTLSGTIMTSDVDTGVSLNGTWTATRLSV